MERRLPRSLARWGFRDRLSAAGSPGRSREKTARGRVRDAAPITRSRSCRSPMSTSSACIWETAASRHTPATSSGCASCWTPNTPASCRPQPKRCERSRRGRVLVQVRPENCVEVSAYWRCWPCLLPQHGPGKKHHRVIRLTGWQARHVIARPDQLLRGLIESDGCRFQNTGRNWSCPRYSFTNHSADIREIFCHACDLLGLRWTASGKHTIYVSRKADVATLDSFIGPKR